MNVRIKSNDKLMVGWNSDKDIVTCLEDILSTFKYSKKGTLQFQGKSYILHSNEELQSLDNVAIEISK